MFVIALPAQNGLVEMDLYHNATPFFTHWVMRNDYLHEPFVIIDVGVQGGPHARWEHLGNRFHIYGFDPISEVIESLNKSKGPNQFYRAIALGNEDGERQFKVTANTYESSFYSSNIDTGTTGAGIALGARTVEVRRLDTLFSAGEIPPADYIKLDCEGFEPEVIRGARNYLARSNVLCVTTETNFGVSPVYLRTPFVDICEMLSQHRLLIFDLNAMRTARPSYVAARRRRPSLEPDLMRDSPRLDIGQPTTFDFVFCRDFVAEAISSHCFVTLPGASLAPTADKLIKSMINFELHGLMDCAVDLAEHFRATLSPRFDVDEAIAHLIVPPSNPRNTADVTECIRMIGALRTRLRHTEGELERAEQRVRTRLRHTEAELERAEQRVKELFPWQALRALQRGLAKIPVLGRSLRFAKRTLGASFHRLRQYTNLQP
jgi:FkbM family methyltransferase